MDKLIGEIMSKKEDNIISQRYYPNDDLEYVLKSIEEICEIFEDKELSFDNKLMTILKNRDYVEIVYNNCDFEIDHYIENELIMFLGEYILKHFIDAGINSYKSFDAKMFIYHIVRNSNMISIDTLLYDYSEEYEYELKIEKNIQSEAEILSVLCLFNKINITNRYKEFDYVKAINPEYMYIDRFLRYNDYDEEVLKISLEKYRFSGNDYLSTFNLDDYEYHMAYLSVLKYHMFCGNTLSGFMGQFLHNLSYRSGFM